ncbi:MAG TPA: hypothetical protein V6D21_11390 [Candidatus Obscuribacterales bacterium]
MLLPTNSYPQFNSDTHFEELLLSQCRKVFELQQTQADIDLIEISSNDKEKWTTVTLNCKGKIVDGEIVAVNPFNFTLDPGLGVYPLGRANLIDSIFHLFVFLGQQEDKLIPVDGDKYVDWSIAKGDTVWDEFDITMSLTEFQLTFDYSNYSSKAKPYLI